MGQRHTDGNDGRMTTDSHLYIDKGITKEIENKTDKNMNETMKKIGVKRHQRSNGMRLDLTHRWI